jgi:hypothetical protein
MRMDRRRLTPRHAGSGVSAAISSENPLGAVLVLTWKEIGHVEKLVDLPSGASVVRSVGQ